MLRRLFGAVSGLAIAGLMMYFVAAPALAGLGEPTPGELGLQLPATSIMEEITTLHNNVNAILIAITLFVLILLLYVMFRFNDKANPTPSRTTHNTLLEVAWTIIPIMILVGIAIPSFKLLYEEYRFPKPDLTIKAIANAWFWDHEYLDQGFTVSSNVVSDEDVLRAKYGDEAFSKGGKFDPEVLTGVARTRLLHTEAEPIWNETKRLRKLTVDQEIAIPVGKVVHLLITSNDVIHSWTIPSFGVKQQAVPGRTAAVWFKADKVGIYRGQCSVLCGKNHSAMPIVVRVVEQGVYDQWIAAMKAKDTKKAKEILSADAAQPPATLANNQ